MDNMINAALKYAASGFSVIPVYAADHREVAKRKTPTRSWKKCQKSILPEKQIRSLFGNGVNLALAGGRVSGNLEALDFDCPELIKPFLEQLESNDAELAKKILVASTPSGGCHLIYRCEKPVDGNLKLARSSDGRKTLIETRGQGGYFLTAPSNGYRLDGSILDVQVISKDERDFLIWLARTFNEYQAPEKLSSSTTPTVSRLRPGDIFNEKADWFQLLTDDGWTPGKIAGERQHWSRPDKTGKATSATLHPEMGLYVFSTSTPLPTETPIDKFGYIIHYRCGGNVEAAVAFVKSIYIHVDSGDKGDRGDTGRQIGDRGATGGTKQMQAPRNYSVEIRQFLDNHSGSFKNSDLDNEFNYRTRSEKKARSKVLCRFEKEGKIKKLPNALGQWRTVITDVKPMKRTGQGVKSFSLPFPLGIQDLVNIFPGNIITIAGETGAGKTGFCLKTVVNLLATSLKKREYVKNNKATTPAPNGGDHLDLLLENGIHYFNSEMGEAEITDWEQSLEANLLDDPLLSIYEDVRYGWEDLTQPNGINFIDYLEVYDNFYNVGQIISDIEAALNQGIAIICLQKAPGKDFGLGGQFSAWKARLVVTLSLSKARVRVAKLQKVKAPKDRRNNPEGKEVDYLVSPSGDFHTLTGWRYVDEKQRISTNKMYQKNPPLMPYRQENDEIFGDA